MKNKRIPLIMLIPALLLSSCGNVEAPEETQEVEVISMIETPIIEEPEEVTIPRESFAAINVSGLNAKDVIGFSEAMASIGWEPQVSCMEYYCDVGTVKHFTTAATIVFFSGHGYVGDTQGYFHFSELDEELHKSVRRVNDSYSYDDESIWSEKEYYDTLVLHHQKQLTEWLVIAACNQLRPELRESVFNAMNEPSELPLKAVLGYGGTQGSVKDEFILDKFITLCSSDTGKGRVAYAWLTAHEIYAPTLSPRARIAIRDGYQNATLISDGPGSEQAGNTIRLWWMTRGDIMISSMDDVPGQVAVEIPIGTEANIISVVNGEGIDMDDIVSGLDEDTTQSQEQSEGDEADQDSERNREILRSQEQALAVARNEECIPKDFRLYRTNPIFESNLDRSEEYILATLHIFARYIGDIRVSVDPSYGEYLHVLMDGTDEAEIDMVYRMNGEINLDNAIIADKNEVLSNEEAIFLGLEEGMRIKEEMEGYSYETELRSIELIYVVSPSDPNQLILAWSVIDDGLFEVIIDARSGEALYWTDGIEHMSRKNRIE